MPLLNLSNHLMNSFRIKVQIMLYVREEAENTYSFKHGNAGATLSDFSDILDDWILEVQDCTLELESYKSNLGLIIDTHKDNDINFSMRLRYQNCVILRKCVVPKEKCSEAKAKLQDTIKHIILIAVLNEFEMEDYIDDFLDRFSQSKIGEWVSTL